jgi:hypothetical protein
MGMQRSFYEFLKGTVFDQKKQPLSGTWRGYSSTPDHTVAEQRCYLVATQVARCRPY